MNTIRIATINDIPLIRHLAEQVFPETYKHIITPAQCDYMMNMMYSETSLRWQMTEEGHIYQLLAVDGEPAGWSPIFLFLCCSEKDCNTLPLRILVYLV